MYASMYIYTADQIMNRCLNKSVNFHEGIYH